MSPPDWAVLCFLRSLVGFMHMADQGIPEINRRLLEMDDGEIGDGSPDVLLAGNEVAAEDLANGMGESVQPGDKHFVVQEKNPRVH